MLDDEALWVRRYKDFNVNIQNLVKETGLSPLLVNILVNRGFINQQMINEFLYSDFKDMHDPRFLPDGVIAADRIKAAVSQGELICIYGDYDVDGITSIAILYTVLKNLGAKVFYYVPDRINEGYGLNQQAILNIRQKGTSLLITVDCGIKSIKEIEMCKNLGMDVIVTDHHECSDTIPDCTAVINPKRSGHAYPFKQLAGVGVVFKLIQLIDHRVNPLDYVDIAALGTIADIVPLVDENRIIVKEGLNKLNSNPHPGIQQIIKNTGLCAKKITVQNVAFIIAPRFNASGRVDSANQPIKLLLNEGDSLQILAQQMEQNNKFRQKIEYEIYQQAIEYIQHNEYNKKYKVLVIDGKNWHQGVIGIVASKIVEKYYKPCIVISVQDGIAKGSARSIDGFDIVKALEYCKDILQNYGGHQQAAGLTLEDKYIELLRERINEYAEYNIDDYIMAKKIYYDLDINSKFISPENINQIKMMAPYGIGNPSPIFRCNNMKIKNIRSIGKNNSHLRLYLSEGAREFDAVYFNKGYLKNVLYQSQTLEILFSMDINEWNGDKNIQLNVKDIKPVMDRYYVQYLYTKYFENISKDYINAIIGEEGLKYDVSIVFDNIDNITQQEHLKNILTNSNDNLILINTAQGIIDFYKFYSKYLHGHKLNIFFKCDRNKHLLANTVIINCIINDINFKKYKNIIFYDLCFSSNYLYNLIKKLDQQKIFFFFDKFKYKYNLHVIQQITLNRRYLVNIYNIIKAEFKSGKTIAINDLNNIIESRYKIKQNKFNLICALDIFSELGFIEYTLIDSILSVHFISNPPKKAIDTSSFFKKINKIPDDFKSFISVLKKYIEGESLYEFKGKNKRNPRFPQKGHQF